MGTHGYCYLVKEMWMQGTPSNPVVLDQVAFATLAEARQHLRRTEESRNSVSEDTYWRSFYRIERLRFGKYEWRSWDYRVDGVPIPSRWNTQDNAKERRRILALKLRPGDLVRVRPEEHCPTSRMPLGGIAVVLAPSQWIATGMIHPTRNYAYFDLYVVDDQGYLGLMIEQCDEIESICTAEDVPERDAILRYLSGRLKQDFDSAHLEIRAMEDARAFVANIALFDHDKKRLVIPSAL